MNKWDMEVEFEGKKMTATDVAVAMYADGEGKSVEEIADFLGEEYHGTNSKGRKVIAKLNTVGVYKKPEAPAKAEKVATIRKEDLVNNIETKAQEKVEGFKLETLARGNIPDLINAAKLIGAEIPEPR